MTPEERAQYIVRNKAELMEKLDSLQRSWLECSIAIQIELAEAAARAAERERCAKLVESCEAAGMGYMVQLGGSDDGDEHFVPDEVEIAAAIRATAPPSGLARGSTDS